MISIFQMSIPRRKETGWRIQGHISSKWLSGDLSCLSMLGFWGEEKQSDITSVVRRQSFSWPLQLAFPFRQATREAVFLQGCLESQDSFVVESTGLESHFLESHLCSTLLILSDLGKLLNLLFVTLGVKCGAYIVVQIKWARKTEHSTCINTVC